MSVYYLRDQSYSRFCHLHAVAGDTTIFCFPTDIIQDEVFFLRHSCSIWRCSSHSRGFRGINVQRSRQPSSQPTGSQLTEPADFQVKVKRQRPAVNAPAMSDANGGVIPYSREGVAQNKQKRKAKRVAAAKAQVE